MTELIDDIQQTSPTSSVGAFSLMDKVLGLCSVPVNTYTTQLQHT